MAKEVPQKWTLKVSYQKEVRRLRDWPCDDCISYAMLKKSVLNLFDLEDVGQTLKYMRDEGQDGQECPLTSETLHTALETATAGLLRVTIVAEQDEKHETREENGRSHDNLGSEISQDPPLNAAEPDTLQAAGTEPHVGQEGNSYYEGWNCFKEQVVTDFRSNYQDMRGALVGDEEDTNRGRQVAGHVAGITAGVCASARLIPLHGTKLAARSIATAAQFPAPADREHQVVDPLPAEPTGEVDRFKRQVFQDFETGRSEIQSAFGYFVGSADAADGAESHQNTQRPRIGRDVIPAVASTIAGLTVATTLVPLRATRLALASLAKPDLPPGSDVPDGVNRSSQSEGVSSS